MILIRKKNATLQEFEPEKIEIAIAKSAEGLRPMSDDEVAEVVALVTGMVEQETVLSSNNVINVATLHDFVVRALREIRSDVAESYASYRNYRKSWHAMMDKAEQQYQELLFLGDKSNANHDSKLASTISARTSGYFGTSMYEQHFLLPKERQAVEDGYIYPHDKDKRYHYPLNCCLFDVANVLKGGFEMANIWYNEPKTLATAFDVIGDIVLSSASQQYGGFTIPEVDNILEPYAQKSYEKYLNEYLELGVDEEKAKAKAEEKTVKDMYQGFQGWEYKFNTVSSSIGDYPFITASFGLNKSKWGKVASIAICDVRRKGQGKEGHKKPVLFPKLVFLYDENLHGVGKELEDVFEAGIQCSSKTMYPDWLSLTGKGYVPSMYKKYGKAISPMGCRAFLSPWYERGGFEPADENDTPVFIGRFNIGAISLNLPMIYQKSVSENKDFYEVLDYYLEMIRNIHLRTYDFLGQIPASRSPMHFCEGGLYGGNLGLDDKIEPVLKTATASFGITALNELQQLYNRKSLVQDNTFSLEVMKYINDKVAEFKKEDGRLYAIYGTPAESLCGKQIKQFRAKYGIVKNVSDREYVSNSFHCHVTEEISPIQKQDLEGQFWDLCNGGKIQYVRYPLGYNIEAMRMLVRRAMELGFYEGVNLALTFCDDCGSPSIDTADSCPCCGSRNLTKIDRMNGYLSYSRVKGDTRLNSAKMAEIAERKSM